MATVHTIERATIFSMMATLISCAQAPDVGVSPAAVSLGVEATAPLYEAVACGPRWACMLEGGPGPQGPGWSRCSGRCEINATLITPTLAVIVPGRLLTQDGLWELGHRTRSQVAAPLDLNLTAFEIGTGLRAFSDGPTVRRSIVMLFEQRLSGIAPYCPHPWVDEDPGIGQVPRYLNITDPSTFDDRLPFRYQPSDPLDDGSRAGQFQAVEPYPTWRDYLRRCAAPLAPDDVPLGSHAFALLSERVNETQIEPIPVAFEYPDGGTATSWFQIRPDSDGRHRRIRRRQ